MNEDLRKDYAGRVGSGKKVHRIHGGNNHPACHDVERHRRRGRVVRVSGEVRRDQLCKHCWPWTVGLNGGLGLVVVP